MDDLITDCITSGGKLAGLQHRLLNGTREIAIAAMSYSTIADVRMTSDSGDGLSCSSEEVFERRWSEGLSMFGFWILLTTKIFGKIDFLKAGLQPIAYK